MILSKTWQEIKLLEGLGLIYEPRFATKMPLQNPPNPVKTRLFPRIILTLLLAVFAMRAAVAQTAFTYQGQLSNNGAPANGAYDFQFSVFDNLSGGAQQGLALNYSAVPVSNGVFMVRLDFGNIFPGGAQRWLSIGVKTNNAATYTTLSPRQEITVSPYAITA